MYSGIGNPVSRQLSGVFCETSGDDETFQAVNKVQVYPGKRNVWLIGRAEGARGSIKDFIEKYIVEPLDTSWLIDNVAYAIYEVPRDSQTGTFQRAPKPGQFQHSMPRIAMQTNGLRMQAKTSGATSPPVKPSGAVVNWYMVYFTPPMDSPQVLPWPVDGCVESADWYLSAATSDIILKTGKKLGYELDEYAVEVDEEVDPMATFKKYSVAAVVVVGAIYLTPAIVRAALAVKKGMQPGVNVSL